MTHIYLHVIFLMKTFCLSKISMYFYPEDRGVVSNFEIENVVFQEFL